jgi:predicted SAM-dependent methyltransferase
MRALETVNCIKRLKVNFILMLELIIHLLIFFFLEWHRVLREGGMLLVGVPDLKTLCRMYLDESLSLTQHWMVTRMMYGGQTDDYDYHLVGFDDSILASVLMQAGFCDIQRVGDFNIFKDASSTVYENYFISLNLVAKKCVTRDDYDGFEIGHNAQPYDPKKFK